MNKAARADELMQKAASQAAGNPIKSTGAMQTPLLTTLLLLCAAQTAEAIRPPRMSALLATQAAHKTALQHPVVRNMAVGGVLGIMGDGIMQAVEARGAGSSSEDRAGSYDARRALRFVLFRVAFTIPLYTLWLAVLENNITPSLVAVAGQSAFGLASMKMVCDCLMFTPAFHATFFTAMALLEGCDASEAIARTAQTLPRSLPASWSFWAPAQLVTFGLVPSHMRVNFVNLLSLSWNACMSGLNQRAREGQGQEL